MSQGRLWRYPNGSYKAVAELELVCIPVLQGRDVALGLSVPAYVQKALVMPGSFRQWFTSHLHFIFKSSQQKEPGLRGAGQP